jgi:hypothetical protein
MGEHRARVAIRPYSRSALDELISELASRGLL